MSQLPKAILAQMSLKQFWWMLPVLLALPTQAVMFYSTDDPTHNTTTPSGALTNSGWQYEGAWGAFLGTPIAPHYFIAASHVGGKIGDLFHFRGVDYTTTASFGDPASDLRLWRVCGTFPDYAPLYSLSAEAHQTVVVIGRGTQRGAQVVASGPFGGVKGWQWGPSDGVERWGTNVVTAIVNGDSTLPIGGGGSGTVGDLLECAFDSNGGADEADLSGGDSSGGVFIQDGSAWKLAGINYAVDGPYNTSASGPGFMAAIFNESGLYKGGEGNWSLTVVPAPGNFYATRISAHLDWITSVLQSPQNVPAPTVWGALTVVGPYHEVSSAVVDTNARTVTFSTPDGTEFYRLLGCSELHITGVRLAGTELVIGYE